MSIPKDQRTGAVDGAHLAANLARLRQERHLARSDLARLSGVSSRTIHSLEAGGHTRIRDTTLIAIAGALGVGVDELLAPVADDALLQPVTRRSRFSWSRAAVAVVAAIVLAAAVEWVARSRADWYLDGTVIVGTHPVLGTRLWQHDAGGKISSLSAAPWSSRRLVLGVTRRHGSNGYFACLDRARGNVLWQAEPDTAQLIRAFDRQTILDAPFSFKQMAEADLDGDRTPEAVVLFTHGLWYPTAICAFGPDGMRSQYASLGHVSTLAVHDLDRDGDDEVILVGTNNTKSYMGAQVVVLDGDHFSGASVDPLSKPRSGEKDGSLYRLVLPMYPPEVMARMASMRLSSPRVDVLDAAGAAPVIRVPVGYDPAERIVVDLAPDLTPLASRCTDAFRARLASWPDSLILRGTPADDAWRAAWLSGHYRFVEGRMVHGDSLLATVPRYPGDTMEN